MATIMLFQTIEHSTHFGAGELWRREFETPFVPRKGDRVVLFAFEDCPPWDGPMNTVKETYWGADGSVHVDLEHFVVDPDEQMEAQIRLSINASSALHGWYVNRDGDLRAMLRDYGWRNHP